MMREIMTFLLRTGFPHKRAAMRSAGLSVARANRGTGGAGVVRTLVVAGVLTAFPLASPFVRAEIVVTHGGGTTTLPDRPQRVLVFDPAALDTLDKLGVEVTGVPGSNLPDYLAGYRDPRYLKIGTLFEPDYEAVAAATPDLIIVGARSAAKRRDLSSIAPTINLAVEDRHFVDGVKRNVETLGRVFGKEAEASALLSRIDGAVARVRADAPGAGTALMVMVNGGKLTAYGPGSRFGWLHDELGVKPAIAEVKAATHGEVISFEFLLKTDPDWLLVLDRDAAVGRSTEAARKVLDNDLIAATRAAKAGRILYLDPVRWYITGGGGAAFATIAEDLALALEAGRSQ
ncbi:putative ABC transporter solute-binding protein YclQ precursor [Blastochloris viridis]|uniref:Putative ABC transporter solute-binding protein yclQ n=2 Tax=Blastochloris viridis TaxID=1079 RepID=A0A0P0JNF1_BLAVI|nr:putative ABC transporter solute-binding protein YclQ precursor [Blastochloris viridis]CUU43533.1 putative ABC transporter solute-binding protein yclQ precursor [Blastochloris viridis]